MSNVRKTVLRIAVVIVLVLVALQGGALMMQHKLVSTNSVVSDSHDLRLPGEAERTVVTVKDVESKLAEVSELSAYSSEYTVTLGKDQMRCFLDDIKIPGTTNSIQITCEGIVKVGYDFKDIEVKVEGNKIFIALPESKVNDNYVIWDTVECNEKNNILNPIEFSQYQEMIDEIEKLGLEDAEKNKVYEGAEEYTKELINGFLSGFTGYEIEYF